MPVTSFTLLIGFAVMATALTFWAMSSFGVLTVLPVLLALAVIARWALAHVPYDDSRT
jgi:predicted RND superfamily exporter protein